MLERLLDHMSGADTATFRTVKDVAEELRRSERSG